MNKIFTLCLLIIAISLKGQEANQQTSRIDKTTFGLGVGLDYGGFGINLTTSLHTNIAVFGGIGYAVSDLGFNFGTKVRMMSETKPSRVTPYGMLMYGRNTFIKIEGGSGLSKSYKGLSVGFGTDFSFKPRKNGYWSIGLIIPIRNSEVDSYIRYLKTYHRVTFSKDLSPVTFSLGYKVIFN
ncbi:MAG: hypothetical protein H6587_02770 [Flavobacteriales bacterium]|nr:hypothetical protein [Flavobacteriales bacterium]MCB9363470.1 hypothetical protein [Flavobacteriales bacterium]